MSEDENPYVRELSTPPMPSNELSSHLSWPNVRKSFLVMFPWPILGMLACSALSAFDRASEAMLLFGGLTVIVVLPLALISISESVVGTLIGIVWLMVLVLPLHLVRTGAPSKSSLTTILATQSLFSALQAGLGFLMLVGKSV